jgi:hypothetical protein
MTEQQPDPVDMDSLTFVDGTLDVVLPVPGPDDIKVPRSYRLPVDLDQWITQTAAAKGQKPSDFVRDMLRLARSVLERESDRQVSMADVLRALATVHTHDAA